MKVDGAATTSSHVDLLELGTCPLLSDDSHIMVTHLLQMADRRTRGGVRAHRAGFYHVPPPPPLVYDLVLK